MNLRRTLLCSLVATISAGCATGSSPDGPDGPELVAAGQRSDAANYAEIGLEFTTWGDFVALVSPKRWKSPIATGGSLSWINPSAWREDAGRTGRILLGEAVVVGGAVAVADAADGSGSGSTGTVSPPPPTGGGGTPPPGLPPAL